MSPGSSATLHCFVSSLAHHTVSWIRQKDLQILSVGSLKVSGDSRVKVFWNQRQGDHVLSIQRTREGDQGLYGCQINTSPPRTLIVKLGLLPTPSRVPFSRSPARRVTGSGQVNERGGTGIRILGAPDIHVVPGGLANLTCVVPGSD